MIKHFKKNKKYIYSVSRFTLYSVDIIIKTKKFL